MATFELTGPDGGTYHVDAPDEHAAIAAFSAFHGAKAPDAAAPPPDKYQQAAIDERNTIFPKERSLSDLVTGGEGSTPTGDAGFTRRLAHGATLGADSTILAALQTPLEMVKRGTFNPAEGYNYAKAREDQIMGDARQNTGALGTAAEVLGGGISGAGLANGGVTAARFLAPEAGFWARSGASAVDAGAMGGFSGAMEGNGIAERFNNAVKGMATGAALGGLTPGALKLAGAAISPVVSNFKAWQNTEGFAQSQIARGIHESGIDPNQLSHDVVQAGNDGQGAYTVADAMGNAGQRLLSTVTRAPGEGRTMAVQALDSRQGDQGRRLAGAFRDAFDAPQTAEQTRAAMSDVANREASFNYAPVKAETQPIDVSNPVAIANRAISPAADRLAGTNGAVATDLAARAPIEGQESIIVDPIRSALKEARSYLAAPTLTSSNVNKAFRAKTNIDQMIASATDKKQGALVGELIPIKDALDEALARTSTNYASARDAYKLAQQRINALDLGKTLGAKPVRPEDAIAQFRALTDPQAQAAFRRGYVDPQISQVQNGAFGTNKARPFTSDAAKQEFNEFATPGRADQLQRQIGRESTMFETRNAAMGGPKTADNLNDHAAMGVDPHLVGQILTGNWHGALKTTLAAGHNALTGNTPAVRAAVGRILLQNGQTLAPGALREMVDRTVQRIQFVQNIARNVGRAASGGLAVSRPGQK